MVNVSKIHTYWQQPDQKSEDFFNMINGFIKEGDWMPYDYQMILGEDGLIIVTFITTMLIDYKKS